MVVSYSLCMSHPLCLHGALSISVKIVKVPSLFSRFKFLIYCKIILFLGLFKDTR